MSRSPESRWTRGTCAPATSSWPSAAPGPMGLAFVAEARHRGAVARSADRASEALATLVVPDARAVLPMLAAIIYGHPARALRLVGITGTLGKTSTALLIQSALEASGSAIGVIGSLGVRVRGRVR